MNNSI